MAAQHKRPRPASAADIGATLKLHRRRLRLDGRGYTVVTLRPDADIRLSTNEFHGTWRILSDRRGARMLGRLLWGLSYQRNPGTLLLIDRHHLDPNPFDAGPADPIALVPSHLTVLTPRAAHLLRRLFPTLGNPDGTVRWRTYGLDLLRDKTRWRFPDPPGWHTIDRIGGLVVLAAPPALMRYWAWRTARLGTRFINGVAGAQLDYPRGEIQILRRYRREVGVARVARAEVLRSEGDMLPLDLEERIRQHAPWVRVRRLPR